MPALNFQKRFATAVENGQKCQTIRARRVDGKPSATIGCTLYLSTGMRTKGCRKLGEAVCLQTAQVFVTEEGNIIVGGSLLRDGAEDDFARADGFTCSCDLVDWIENTHGLPFEGSLIEWGAP